MLLGGRFRGRRVVFLKHLGPAMVVTGPLTMNGVPIKKVNPRFCIAASTKVDKKVLSKSFFLKKESESLKYGDTFIILRKCEVRSSP